MSEVNQNNAGKWSKWVTDFDKSYNLFADNYAGLLAQKSFVQSRSDLLPQFNALVSAAQRHKETLDKLKATRDKVLGWMKTYQGMQAPQSAWSGSLLYGIDDLGVIPVLIVGVSIASASAALVAISAWIKEAYVFSKVLEETRRLEAKGLTPQEAARVAKSNAPSAGIFGLSGTAIKIVAIAAIVLVIAPPVLRAIEKRG